MPIEPKINGCSAVHPSCWLVVTVFRCSNLKDTNPLFSRFIPPSMRQDPYVLLEYAGMKFKTKVCYGGHKDPTFNQTFTIPHVKASQLNIEVWDKDCITSDDFIGKASISLSDDLLFKGPQKITRSLEGAGEIHLLLELVRNAQDA